MAPRSNANKGTPGRRKRSDNQYFDVGKVGRKTGITLNDTGIRDEYGLEPVSGIFSSPERNGETTLESDGMDVQDINSAPNVRDTLTQRKTPRFPPPRQSTPRHTNIGSPKRMSSARRSTRAPNPDYDHDDTGARSQRSVNRKLEYGSSNRDARNTVTMDTHSPFKPRNVLRRSNGPIRPDPFDIPEDEDDVDDDAEHQEPMMHEDEAVEQSIEDINEPMPFGDDDDSYPVEEDQGLDVAEEMPEAPASSDSPLKRKRGRPRRSDQTGADSQLEAEEQALDESSALTENGELARPLKKNRTSNSNKVIVHRDEGSEIIDHSGVAYGDEYVVDDGVDSPLQESNLSAQLDSQLEVTDSQPTKGRGRPKGKKGKAAAAPKERDPNRAMSTGESPSKRNRGQGAGPVSNVNLRATTPFDDANQQTSRFGRNLIQPLKYWENESRIWRGGEIEGIVRAEHVEKPNIKASKRKRRGKKPAPGNLHAIEEESETESVIADEWEEAIGVISGAVASWSQESEITKTGDADNPRNEDLAFAASSIITRDVAGSDFKYAKIMTLPFFGAGVVELPPEGFKRAKNSRRMQMAFFVHEGKVMVEVGAMGMEVNSFALSKGGVWLVPRGNNYSITNESRTTTAKIFFAQGCELTAGAAES